MSYSRIENWKLGGEAVHKIAFFMHRSICDVNIQLLNWSEKCADSTSLHMTKFVRYSEVRSQ